MSEIF